MNPHFLLLSGNVISSLRVNSSPFPELLLLPGIPVGKALRELDTSQWREAVPGKLLHLLRASFPALLHSLTQPELSGTHFFASCSEKRITAQSFLDAFHLFRQICSGIVAHFIMKQGRPECVLRGQCD